MKECTFHIVDAFTTTPFTGNPCAVVTGADGLTDDEMVRIARETNAPETAFALKSDKADIRVRYFMPRGEIPFAGHPTIATGHLLRELGVLKEGTARFEFNIGVLPVDIAADHITMTQPPAVPDTIVDSAATMKALGLTLEDLREGLPCQLMKAGVSFLMVPVKKLEVLRRIHQDRAALKAILSGIGVSAAYVFAPEGEDPATHIHARLIDPDNAGEDPFTGSAAGCMVSYLFAHKIHPGNIVRLEQGHILERPGNGTLELKLAADGSLETILLSGSGVVSATGTLRW